jgi:hypothetical protein
MAINTLITLKDALIKFANDHAQIKRIEFESDDHREPKITEGDEFPMLFVAPINVQVGRAMNTHTLRIYVYERINDDRLDVLENANDTSLILRDIRVWWNDYGTDDIEIKEDLSGEFVCDRELDNVVGYFADVRFDIPSHGRCSVPINVSPSPEIVCAPATYQITDSGLDVLYSGTIASGGSLDQLITDSTYVVQYENGTLIESGTIKAQGGVVVEVLNPIVCADANISLNGEAFPSIPCGGSANIQVRQSSGSVLVGSKQGQYFRIADSEAVLKNTSGTVISTTAIKAEQSEDIIAPNSIIEVNGVSEGIVVAGATLDVQLSNIDGVVIPLSVTQMGNNLAVVLPYCPLAETIASMFEGRVIFDNGTFEAETCLINILKDEFI